MKVGCWGGVGEVVCEGRYLEREGESLRLRLFIGSVGPAGILASVGEVPRRWVGVAGGWLKMHGVSLGVGLKKVWKISPAGHPLVSRCLSGGLGMSSQLWICLMLAASHVHL